MPTKPKKVIKDKAIESFELEIRITGDDFDFTGFLGLKEAGEIITYLARVREMKIKYFPSPLIK